MLQRIALISGLACVAFAKTISLATFDGAEGTTYQWKQMNDPVMGGKSTGTFKAENGLGIFDGEVVDVPFLKAPGFIKVDSVDAKMPDISSCKAIELVVSSTNDYAGFYFSFGRSHPPEGKTHAFGHKTDFRPPVGKFGTVSMALDEFSDYWDDATGKAIKTCKEDKKYCPDEKTLQDMRTMAVWAEGVAGKVHLQIKSVSATGCTESAEDDQSAMIMIM